MEESKKPTPADYSSKLISSTLCGEWCLFTVHQHQRNVPSSRKASLAKQAPWSLAPGPQRARHYRHSRTRKHPHCQCADHRGKRHQLGSGRAPKEAPPRPRGLFLQTLARASQVSTRPGALGPTGARAPTRCSHRPTFQRFKIISSRLEYICFSPFQASC